MSLSVNRNIRVNLTINPLAAANRGFGTALIIGDSDVISSSERIRSYSDIGSVAEDFGVDAPEYEAAQLYFAQSPAPASLMIGKWNKTATTAILKGGILSSADQSIVQWRNITNGTFKYTANGNSYSIQGLNFSNQSNLNGIAEVINSKLQNANIKWDGERFIMTSLSTGSDQSLDYLQPVASQTNIHEMLGLSEGLANATVGTDRIAGTPAKEATSGALKGTDISDQLNTLKGIKEGSFKVTVDGEQISLSYLDFSSASTLNDVASKVTEKLKSKATCTYGNNVFTIVSNSTGSKSTVNNAIAGEVTTAAKDATAGKLVGSQKSDDDLETLKQVSNGSFKISIDDSEQTLDALNFSEASSMNDIASKIQAGLNSKATCTYNNGFIITSNTTGVTSKVGLATEGPKTVQDTPATAGYYKGTVFSDDSSLLDNLKLITEGTLKYTVDAGGEQETSAIDLSSASSLQKVAELIQAKISGVKVTYESDKSFKFTSNTTGAKSKVIIAAGTDSNLFTSLQLTSGEQQTGTDIVYGTDNQLHIKLGLSDGVPTNGEAEVLANDNQLHTKLGLASGQSTVGTDYVPEVPTIEATAGKLTSGRHATIDQIRGISDGNFSISIDNGLTQTINDLDFSKVENWDDVCTVIGTKLKNATIAAVGTALVITSATVGRDSTVGYATPATLDERDISAKLKMTMDTALPPINGFDAESPLQATQILCDKSANWYGLVFAGQKDLTDSQTIDIAKFIESYSSAPRIYGVTITDSRTLSSDYTLDLASQLKELNLNRTVTQYSQNPYAICSFLGRAFTVNFNGSMTTITMMYKQEPSVAAEDLSESQAQALENKRCNVFVKYDNDTSIIQQGVMCGDYWFDERHGADWLQNYIQTAVWNLFYTSTTKIGQDDAGINAIISTINNSLAQAKENGFIGAGVWNGDGFGQLEKGATLTTGYYVYASPLSSQSQADREHRISVPIQIAAKLLGAIHEVDISITLNR